jgi:hypothetical protein
MLTHKISESTAAALACVNITVDIGRDPPSAVALKNFMHVSGDQGFSSRSGSEAGHRGDGDGTPGHTGRAVMPRLLCVQFKNYAQTGHWRCLGATSQIRLLAVFWMARNPFPIVRQHT